MTTIRDVGNEVMEERKRQLVHEGWSRQHDDRHTDFELLRAAVAYALASAADEPPTIGDMEGVWPWEEKWWKPTTPRRNLIKAAALIVAEIERLDRAEESQIAQ